MNPFDRIKQYIIGKKQKLLNNEKTDLFKLMENESLDAFSKDNINNFDDKLYDTLNNFSFDFGGGFIEVGNYIKNYSNHNCHTCAIILALTLGLTNPELQSKIKICYGNLNNMKYQWDGNTSHSWVEVGGANDCVVYDTSWHKIINKESYYKIFNPTIENKLNYDELHEGYRHNLQKNDIRKEL